jgi:hypothetical protein
MLAYTQLPFVDEHAVDVDGPREQVWERLERTAPSMGFHVTESTAPSKLVLEGRHPFSRYALVFLVEPLDGGRTRVRAQTWAAFPGLHGRVYRLLVIGSGLHVLAVRRMLRRVA